MLHALGLWLAFCGFFLSSGIFSANAGDDDGGGGVDLWILIYLGLELLELLLLGLPVVVYLLLGLVAGLAYSLGSVCGGFFSRWVRDGSVDRVT